MGWITGRAKPAAAAVVALAVVAAACGRGGEDPRATLPPVLTGPGPSGAAAAATGVTAGMAASPTPAPRGTPVTAPIELPIFMYHHVAAAAPAGEFEARLTVLTADFDAELAYLKCAGYTGITLAQLFDAIGGGVALPQKPVILTFDDGYSDAYTDAFPLLQQYGFPGAFSIITSAVGGGDGAYMTWDELKTMADAGMEITSHTVSHPDLGTSDDATVRDELASSKAALEQRLGRPVRFLVYPSGEPFRSGAVERQQQVVSMLKQAGYDGALLAGPDSLTQDPAAPFALNRVRVSGGEDVATFAASIGGPAC